jgi:methylated-DNA-protein-cysteine methyltransferase-like protein
VSYLQSAAAMALTRRRESVATNDARRSGYDRIYAVVRQIPHGRVATYGQVAKIAGLRGHARQVGYALHAAPSTGSIPWHRVINAKGEISPRSEPGFETIHRAVLEREGVSFDGNGRVSFRRHRWKRGLA